MQLKTKNFPTTTMPASPFHAGETTVQTRLGVRDAIEPWARKVVRPYMPDQHREFFEEIPFFVAAARDDKGRMWSTLLMGVNGEPGFARSPTPTTLELENHLVRGDALTGSIHEGSDLGILGIDFASKRRNRVNGRVTQMSRDKIEFKVDQSFGNCPQYIKPRQWWSTAAQTAPPQMVREESAANGAVHPPVEARISTQKLNPEQIRTIKSSETIFLATGYRGGGEDPSYGSDASHRGGPPGFVHVSNNGKTLQIPDYSGNNHFNTIGNLQLDHRLGVTIPRFDAGGMIQLTGTAVVDWDRDRAVATHGPGAQRVIVFSIEDVVDVPDGSLPIRWSNDDLNDESRPRKLQVIDRVEESEEVTSFLLKPEKGVGSDLWTFRAGQHLPISLKVDRTNDGENEGGETISRTYSLSCGPEWGIYRISVKRERNGLASRHLHDHVKVGDSITSYKPAGDFVLSEDAMTTRKRTTVLISAGVGVTPMMSMLHQFVQGVGAKPFIPGQKPLVFIHGARDGKHHPFKEEVKELVGVAGSDAVRSHTVYSRPLVEDFEYDSVGRMDAGLLAKVVGEDMKNADFYMCGPVRFMANIRDDMEEMYGIDSKRIYAEAF